MNEKRDLRVWVVLGVILTIPALVIVSRLLRLYPYLFDGEAWTGIAFVVLGVAIFCFWMLVMPKLFNRSISRGRRRVR